MLKIVHFADAHIDMAAQGRHDPQTGMPLRALDFLKALDTVVDAAITEHADLVLFAGDAYKDRTPVPTFQREWGRRMMRLSQAGIQTLLLVGNHDLSPSIGRAHALQEYETLQVPHIRVVSRPELLRPADLEGLPLQVLALPWVSRSGLMAALEMGGAKLSEVYTEIEARLTQLVYTWLDEVDPSLPVILLAHASVQGAKYGGERSVMLGGDLVLPGSLVCDPRLDYTALGHIHKAQDLNAGQQPPVIYPGSIERVDFGEAADEKYYVLLELQKGQARPSWRRLDGRRFIDCALRLESPDEITRQLIDALPPAAELEGAIVRLTVEMPAEWQPMLDEAALRRHAEAAFEFHFLPKVQREARLRLPGDQAISSLSPVDLLDLYWKTQRVEPDETAELQKLAAELIQSVLTGKE